MNFAAYAIPEYMHSGIINYVEHHIPPGDFLRSVFSNDLFGAAVHADSQNRTRLAEYVRFAHEEMPVGSYGSPANVLAWLRKPELQTKDE